MRRMWMKEGVSRERIDHYLKFIEFTGRHPALSRAVLWLAYRIPPLKRALPVSMRIYMGGRILESYRVDKQKGEISFGGVDRQIVGAEFPEVVFRNLAQLAGKEEAQRIMYDMHFRIMEEQLQKLDLEEIFPRFLAHLFRQPADAKRLESDPTLARLYGEMERMLLRLLFSESGWGRPEFDSTPLPSKVTVHKSVESVWMRPSAEPVCYAMAGSLAAFVSHIAGKRYAARETSCAATGAPRCEFTLESVE